MNHSTRLWQLSCKLTALGLASCAALSCASRTETPAARVEQVPVAEIIKRADGLWAQRATLDRVREGVVLLRRARTTEARNYETAWRLARFAYHVGAHGADEKERDTAFREGITAGQAAVKLAADRPEGHFWLGANIGGRTELQGAIGSLAAVEDIRREMEAVIRIDEGYQGGSAYLALGSVELELPKMLGGDRERAVEYLEKGLRFGERNALLRVRLAEAYLAVKRRDDARKQLNTVINMTPEPDYLPEYREAVEEARELLGKIDEGTQLKSR